MILLNGYLNALSGVPQSFNVYDYALEQSLICAPECTLPISALVVFSRGQAFTLTTVHLANANSGRLLSGLCLRLLDGDVGVLLLVVRVDQVESNGINPGKHLVAMDTLEGVLSAWGVLVGGGVSVRIVAHVSIVSVSLSFAACGSLIGDVLCLSGWAGDGNAGLWNSGTVWQGCSELPDGILNRLIVKDSRTDVGLGEVSRANDLTIRK